MQLKLKPSLSIIIYISAIDLLSVRLRRLLIASHALLAPFVASLPFFFIRSLSPVRDDRPTDGVSARPARLI